MATYPAETRDGTVTSFLPLTTAFASASGCSNSLMWEGDRFVAYDPGYGVSVHSNAICQPDVVTTWWIPSAIGIQDDQTVFSIGPLQCPDGWSTVATSVIDIASTQAMCCPPGYTLDSGTRGQITGDCFTTIASGDVITYGTPIGSGTGSWSVKTSSCDSSLSVGAIAIVGWNIQQTAAPAAPTSTLTSPLASTATTLSSPSSLNSSFVTGTSKGTSVGSSVTNTNTSQGGNATSRMNQATPGSLSTGAKIGIGVGAGLGILGFIALGGAFLLLRRKGRKTAADTAHDSLDHYVKSELDATTSQVYSVSETGQPQSSISPSTSSYHELGDPHNHCFPHELHA